MADDPAEPETLNPEVRYPVIARHRARAAHALTLKNVPRLFNPDPS